jgi:hypothetical protein
VTSSFSNKRRIEAYNRRVCPTMQMYSTLSCMAYSLIVMMGFFVSNVMLTAGLYDSLSPFICSKIKLFMPNIYVTIKCEENLEYWRILFAVASSYFLFMVIQIKLYNLRDSFALQDYIVFKMASILINFVVVAWWTWAIE